MPALILPALAWAKGLPWKMIGIAALAIVIFGAGWTVRGWRDGLDVAEQKAEAATTLAQQTEAARSTERADARAAQQMDKDHADRQDQIAQAGDANRAITDGIDRALDRVRRSGRGNGGDGPVPAARLASGGAATGAPDRDRADRCEALLREGVELVAEGSGLLRDVAGRHDLAAEYARVGHEWAVRPTLYFSE